WMNYWSSGMRFEYSPEVYDDRLTRGGPLSRTRRGFLVNANVSTDSRKTYTLNARVSYSAEEGGAYSRSGSMSITLRPRVNWEIVMGPSISRRYSEAQYVSSLVDERASDTFGRRYIFAGIDQTTLSIDTRVNITFTPTRSFQ